MIVTKYLLVYPLDDNYTLLINTLSGALDIVDHETGESLAAGNIPGNPDTNTQLKERFYLFETKEEEGNFFSSSARFLDVINPRENSWMGLILCPTYSCNLRCPYCFQDHDLHKSGAVMTTEQVDAVFAAMETHLAKYLEVKEYTIQLFGGEPLQRKTRDIVGYILKTAGERKKHITIITNGVDLDPFWELFSSFTGSLSFQVTLDGIAAIHDQRRIFPNGGGTFNIITENIDRLLKIGFRVRVRININQDNIPYLPGLLDYFEKKEWTRNPAFISNFSPVTEHSNLPTCASVPEFELFSRLLEVFPDLKQLHNRYRTMVGGDMFRIVGHMNRICNPAVVPKRSMPSVAYCEAAQLTAVGMGPDDFIYPCAETFGFSEYAIGRFFPFFELYNEKISGWKNRTIFQIEECSQCTVAMLCGGGCPFAALKFNGKPDSPFCGNTRDTIDKFIALNKQRFLEMARSD